MSKPLTPGDPVPWFRAPTAINPEYDFATVAGRYVVLCCFPPGDTRMHAAFLAESASFDGFERIFFGVAPHAPNDALPKRPGMEIFFDPRHELASFLGAEAAEPLTYIIGPDLRVLCTLRRGEPEQQAKAAMEIFNKLPPLPPAQMGQSQAPVLVLPNVFEPDFCRRLIAGYEKAGGHDSGFMQDRDGKTVLVVDHSFKRRSDWVINDLELIQEARDRIQRRLVPEVAKSFQFSATRMERYLVCCYDSTTGGYFHAHRDNTTKGTAHRRFAVTLNLNSEEYQGGELMFPEFGRNAFKPPTGGAVVFSCSLLHRALPVREGRRFVFVPFLYDDAASKIREANNVHLAEDVLAYRPETLG
jgi:predicted 2-oxoglutarate/Fe(II)-dependent dioxygenase YbiX/peroxiredoxin